MFDNKYPYTDYHELNLDWFMGEFKKLVAEWEETKGEWNTLHDYVQTYFDNLNVQTEIDNKINAMILDGTFADIVSPFVTAALPALVAGQLPDVVAAQISAVVAAQISAVVAAQLPAVAAAAAAAEVGDWLTAHIDPDTGYVIDDTLTVSQAAADAKATGDVINDISYFYIPTNYGIIETSDAYSPNLNSLVIADTSESVVTVKNTSGVNTMLYFPLADLGYGEHIGYDIRMVLSEFKAEQGVGLYYNVGADLTPYQFGTMTHQEDGSWLQVINDMARDFAYGQLWIGVSIRYNQTTDGSIRVTAYIKGDAEKRYIKNDAIKDLEMSNLSNDLQSLIINGSTYPTIYRGDQISTFNKGVAIGDSLTSGVFNTSDGYITQPQYAYPAKLNQLTGVDIDNLGVGGQSSAQWYASHSDADLSGYQFAIIQLGVNDAIQNNGWSAESETAFTNIITKLQNENDGIFIFIATIIPATSYTGAKYDSVSQGIRDLIDTLNDEHVILLDMAVYGNTANESAYNNGHLTALGYERLALDYKSYISYIISQDLHLFRNIQFIS